MTTIEKELANAYGEVIDAEIEATLASAEQERHEFSPEFKKRMEELIKTGDPNKKNGLSKRGKRILIIAIAAVVALTLTACAVPEIRESIAGFFVKIFGDHVEYSDPEVMKDAIEEEYGLVPVPDGFAINYHSKINGIAHIQYSSEKFGDIQLIQGAKVAIDSFVDNEHGSFTEHSVGDKFVRVYNGEESMSASWVENGYYFILTCNFPVEQALFESWIDSVQIVE